MSKDMSKSKADDGGPIFPVFKKAGDLEMSEGGLTVRDYFATQAMAAMLTPLIDISYPDAPPPEAIPAAADLAYVAADEMLKRRRT